MKTATVVSVSGGKDSTATLLLALERNAPNIHAIFCDTGHEHPSTYEYIEQLAKFTGVEIKTLRADFTSQIEKRRAYVDAHWPEPQRTNALAVLKPSGSAFLDLCMVKSCFPSSGRRFCTSELKVFPAQRFFESIVDSYERIESWVGVRADESLARSKALPIEMEYGNEETGHGLYIVRPILNWSAYETIGYIQGKGCPLNPLYLQGMGRVGCMPCIMSRKTEISEIAKRFPAEIERVAEWERIVSACSLRETSTFFYAHRDPLAPEDNILLETHGIRNIVDWANSGRGGVQRLLELDEGGGCNSVYGLCE